MDLVVVFRVVEVVGIGPLLHLRDAVYGQGDGLGALVNGEVGLVFQSGHQLGKALVELHRLVCRSADNQRCPGFVNEDVIDLVNNGVVQVTLYSVGRFQRHIVP